MSCRLLHGGQLSDNFIVKTKVRQRRLLSPSMFRLVVDWIMRTSTKGRRNGIQWTLWLQLNDLELLVEEGGGGRGGGGGGADAYMRARIGKTRTAFLILEKVWSSRQIGNCTKLRTLNRNVSSVLLDGSETWRTTNETLHELQTSINSCLRTILCIRYPEKIRNEDLWKQSIKNQ